MIEQAFVSGRAGAAFLVKDGGLWRVDIGEDEPRLCQPGEAASIAAMGGELEELPPDQLTLEHVRGRLEATTLAYRALILTVSGMDTLLRPTVRRSAIAEASHLTADDARAQFVRNRLYGCPLAEDGDPGGAAELAAEIGAALAPLYLRLRDLAPTVADLHGAWNRLVSQDDVAAAVRGRLTALLVDSGGFAALAAALADKSQRLVDDAVLTFGMRADIRSLVPNAVKLLRDVTKAVQRPFAPAQPVGFRIPDGEDPGLPGHAQNPILDLIETMIGGEDTDVPFAPFEAKSKVDRQIEAIANEMRARRLTRARRYLVDLVGFQVENSRPEHLAKTFCALASRAMDLRLLDLATELLEYAHALGVEDPVTSNCSAELLRKKGDIDAALATYDATIRRFPDYLAALNGRAETLRERGDLDQALAAYDATIERFPDEVVACNGRAELLKERGDLDGALHAYNSNIERFPDSTFAHNGRAGLLRERGDLAAALVAYETNVDRFNDVFACTGRAEVLKEMGNLDAALEAYDLAVEQFPENVAANCGRAAVLKERGDLDAALAVYDALIRDFPESAFPHTGRAEVLKERGDLDGALTAYDAAIQHFPNEVVPLCGRAEVLKERGDLAAALRAYDAIVERFPREGVARNARAGVLLLLGRVSEARAGLPSGAPQTRQEWIGYHILGMADLREGRLSEAVERFTYGSTSAPTTFQRRYFAHALAIARLRAGAFKTAEEILSSTLSSAGREREKIGVLLVHAQAGMGDVPKARRTLQQFDEIRHPKLASLRDHVVRRFGLLGPRGALPSDEKTTLDAAIDRMEFELALAA